MDIAIIGAGISGLAVANNLAPKNKVTVYESQDSIGGLARVVSNDIFLAEKYNIFFSREDQALIDLTCELGLDAVLTWKKVPQGLIVKNKIHSIGNVWALLTFSGLNFHEKISLAKFVLKIKKLKKIEPLIDLKATDWLKNICGEAVYKKFFLPMLCFKFEKFDDISAAYMYARFKENKQGEIGFFMGGINVLLQALKEKILEAGGDLFLTEPVMKIKQLKDKKWEITSSKKTQVFDVVVSTLPLIKTQELLLDLIAKIPESKDIDYLSICCLRLTLNQPLSRNKYWLYLSDWNNPEKTRVVVNSSVLGCNNIVYFPRYYRKDSDCPNNLKSDAINALKKINSKFDESWICEESIFRDCCVEPVLSSKFLRLKLEAPENFDGLFLNELTNIPEMLKTVNTAIIKSKVIYERVKKYYEGNSTS